LSKSEEFINIYNNLDKYMRNELQVDEYVGHTSIIDRMIKKGNIFFRTYKDDLKSFANLRNAIIHNPDRKTINPIAEPHEIVVSKYKEIMDKVLNPPKALNEIAIPSQNIYKINLADNALEVMKIMNKNIFTHVPVLKDDKMVGVFSENTIFTFFTEKEEAIFDDEMTIEDFNEFIPIDKHPSEVFIFVPRNITMLEIEEIFKNEINDNKRISAIFITENGKEDEKLLGLITPWDIAGYQD